MHHVPEMAARLEKRPGKLDAFEIVKKAVAGSELEDKDLAVLYGFFLPPPPKKAKNILEWITLACDTNGAYSFCKHIQVTNGTTVAASPKRSHIAFGDVLGGEGWYDTHGGKVGDDVAIMPDVNKAVMTAMCGEPLGEIDTEALEIRETPTGLAYVLPWCDLGVNKTYFDAMFQCVESPTITGSRSGAFAIHGKVFGHDVYAVVMPFRLSPI